MTLPLSKSDHFRYLASTEGWWHDPKWGVAGGKTFREWSNRLWRAKKGMRGPSNARDYNLTRKAIRLRGAI